MSETRWAKACQQLQTFGVLMEVKLQIVFGIMR